MIARFVILAVVVAGAFVIVSLVERRRGGRRTGLEPGMLLVTAPGCALCGPAERALAAAGLAFRKVDASDVPDLGVRSVPTLFIVDQQGALVARRSGRAAVMTPAELAGWS